MCCSKLSRSQPSREPHVLWSYITPFSMEVKIPGSSKSMPHGPTHLFLNKYLDSYGFCSFSYQVMYFYIKIDILHYEMFLPNKKLNYKKMLRDPTQWTMIYSQTLSQSFLVSSEATLFRLFIYTETLVLCFSFSSLFFFFPLHANVSKLCLSSSFQFPTNAKYKRIVGNKI